MASAEIDWMIARHLGGQLDLDGMLRDLGPEKIVDVLPFPRRVIDTRKEVAFRAKHRRNLLVHLSRHMAHLRYRQWEHDFPEQEALVMHKVRCAPLPWVQQPRSCRNDVGIEDLYGVDYCERVLAELRGEQHSLQSEYERTTRNEFRASHDLACGCPDCRRNK
jgi:hypothetical protein